MLDRADCADFGCHNSIRLETKHFLNTLALTFISFSGRFVFAMQKHYLFFCERSSSCFSSQLWILLVLNYRGITRTKTGRIRTHDGWFRSMNAVHVVVTKVWDQIIVLKRDLAIIVTLLQNSNEVCFLLHNIKYVKKKRQGCLFPLLNSPWNYTIQVPQI